MLIYGLFPQSSQTLLKALLVHPMPTLYINLIALKECHETLYWLELLYKTEYLPEDKCQELYDACIELRKLLSASVNTVSRKQETK